MVAQARRHAKPKAAPKKGRTLVEALRAAVALTRKVESRPLEYMRWTPPQADLLRSTSRRVLLRTGNQLGKTTAGLAEVIYRCLGRHPYKPVPAAPIEAWIITASWSQSIAIQEKLWNLLPKDQLCDDVVFDPAFGFGTKSPLVKFLNGSKIRIKTSRQGGLSLAGATIHLVMGDEPFKSSRIYGEIDKRLMRTGGTMILTLTPINAPVGWLRELVERNQIVDLHHRLSAENLTPEGATVPLSTETGEVMDEEWIKLERAKALSWEEPIVCDGEWEERAIGQVFENFRPHHVVPNLLRSQVGPRGDNLKLTLGIDYGEDRLRTAAILSVVDDTGPYPRVWAIGEYSPEVSTTTDQDAEAILAMLSRAGFRWEDLDWVFGDKRYTDASGRTTKKSNRMMMQDVEKLLGVSGARPIIRSAKRGAGAGRGAVRVSIRWLNMAMIRPGHFYIDESCVWLRQCLEKWDLDERSMYKDAIDAAFYSYRPWAIRFRPEAATVAVSVRSG